VKVGKLCKCENGGGYYLPNWGEYQLSERHKRRFKEKIQQIQALSAETDMMVKKPVTIYIGEDIKNKKEEDIKVCGEFENVKLKKEEYEKLVKKFGETGAKERIENLSRYIASKGKKYTSHYATILNWERGNPKISKPKIEGDYPRAKDVLKGQGFSEEDFTWKDK
jgi:hypothetical protein